MMVEMSDDVVGELLSALFKLGALQLRLGIITTEVMLTFGSRANQSIGALDKSMPSAISEEEIEACGQGHRSETDHRSRIRLSKVTPGNVSSRAPESFGRTQI
jgi:hypothetical protein